VSGVPLAVAAFRRTSVLLEIEQQSRSVV